MKVAIEMAQAVPDRPAPDKAKAPKQGDSRFEKSLREARQENDPEQADTVARPPEDAGATLGNPADDARQARPPQFVLSTSFGGNGRFDIPADAMPVEEASGSGDATVPPSAITPPAPEAAVPARSVTGDATGMDTARSSAAQVKPQLASAAVKPELSVPPQEIIADPGRDGDATFEPQRILLGEEAPKATSPDPLARAQTSAASPARTMPAVVPLDHVAVHIAKSAASGLDKIQIHLTPASLGTIDVDLELAHDGRVDAVVRVDKPETMELLQRDARQLVRALQDAGLQADSGSLSFELRDQGGHREKPTAPGDSGGDGDSVGSGGDVAASIPQQSARRLMPGGVDIIA